MREKERENKRDKIKEGMRKTQNDRVRQTGT